MLLTVLLGLGIREAAGANSVMVAIKLSAIFLFIVFASRYIKPMNWHPFMPNGWQGVLTGGAIVFFSYIGFDSVSTAAGECKDPKRDLPLGILASLFVCATLYVGVAVVLTGIQPFQIFKGDAASVATALRNIGLDRLQQWVTIGALMGMISSLLVSRALGAFHPDPRDPHLPLAHGQPDAGELDSLFRVAGNRTGHLLPL